MTNRVLSRGMANRVPPDAMADLSRVTKVASNLSMTNRVLSRGMANRVPPSIPPLHGGMGSMADLSRGSRVMSSSILRAHQKIGPP